VFPSSSGLPLDSNNFTRVFGRIFATLKLPAIRLHDLRHLAATFALASGGDIHEVKSRPGHAEIRATAIYTHVLEHRDQAIAGSVKGC
jgi:site-specific recombinase XerD